MPDAAADWFQRPLSPLNVQVGPCAWRLPMFAGPHATYVRARPSLVVVNADDADALLQAAAPNLADLPVLLRVREPAFARQLPDLLNRRFAALGRNSIEIVMLEVDEVADLKGGGMMQTLTQWREAKRILHLGLAHEDVRNVEWLARSTPARALSVPLSLADQSARYRTIPAAVEFGMARVAAAPPDDDGDALRFALGTADLALPVLDRPLPENVTPMSATEVEAVWAAYQSSHEPPAPLARSQPPE